MSNLSHPPNIIATELETQSIWIAHAGHVAGCVVAKLALQPEFLACSPPCTVLEGWDGAHSQIYLCVLLPHRARLARREILRNDIFESLHMFTVY